MSLVTRLFVVCASGCGLVPFFLKNEQKNDLHSTATRDLSPFSDIPIDLQEDLEELLKEDPEEKNCTVIDKLSKNIFWDLVKEEEDYITISCKNTNVDNSGIIPDNWKGLFPKILFQSQSFHQKGFEFELKTKTEKLGSEGYNTIFFGSSLEASSIVGEWNKQTTISDGQSLITVDVFGRLGNKDSIYLLFPTKN